MALGQNYEVSVPPGVWTLLVQSSVAGDGLKQYLGFTGTGEVPAFFRCYHRLTAVNQNADPAQIEFRHAYRITPSDRTAMVADKAEVLQAGLFAWLEVFHAGAFGRTVNDGTTASNTTVTSATAAFVNAAAPNGDVGAAIFGGSIPVGATIVSVQSATQCTISAPATATASGLSLTICDPTNHKFTGTILGG